MSESERNRSWYSTPSQPHSSYSDRQKGGGEREEEERERETDRERGKILSLLLKILESSSTVLYRDCEKKLVGWLGGLGRLVGRLVG